MSATTLLAELRRRGISAEVTSEGRLRLDGPSEEELTPELRQAVEAQRADLLALLRTAAQAPAGGNAAPSGSLLPSDSRPAAPTAQNVSDGQPEAAAATIPAWLGWGAAIVGAIFLVGCLAARPQASAASPPALLTSQAFPLGVPYNGWGAWG